MIQENKFSHSQNSQDQLLTANIALSDILRAHWILLKYKIINYADTSQSAN